MQIIESTKFGVRSALFQFEAGPDDPRIILFPMIHVAETEFYEEITGLLEKCDLILCEGVRSPTATLLSATHRYFAKSPKLGLVSQRSMNLDHLEERLVHADVDADEFEGKWSTLPFWLRLGVSITAPILGLYLRYFGTRADIASVLGMELRKYGEEIHVDNYAEKIEHVVIDWRDQRLLQVLDRHTAASASAGASIGVFFGAAHMRSVIRHLMDDRGYKIVGTQWVTVFGI